VVSTRPKQQSRLEQCCLPKDPSGPDEGSGPMDCIRFEDWGGIGAEGKHGDGKEGRVLRGTLVGVV
jgi:hypothetical protein